MFSEHGDHLSEFTPVSTYWFWPGRIAFHHSSANVVLVDAEADYVYLNIYTKDGELVRSIKTRVTVLVNSTSDE